MDEYSDLTQKLLCLRWHYSGAFEANVYLMHIWLFTWDFKPQKLFTGDTYFTGEYEKQSCDPRRILQEMSIATFQMGNGK